MDSLKFNKTLEEIQIQLAIYSNEHFRAATKVLLNESVVEAMVTYINEMEVLRPRKTQEESPVKDTLFMFGLRVIRSKDLTETEIYIL